MTEPNYNKRVKWDETGKRLYETGVRQVVLYLPTDQGVYDKGVAWNGVTAVNEKPTGAESNPLYADDSKYVNLISEEDFEATIEAYTYPDEWAECDGSRSLLPGLTIGGQPRKAFGLCYRTTIGNDLAGTDYGYKLHLVYGGMATPSERDYSTMNDNPEANTFSWDISTTPVAVTGHKPTAIVTVDSTKFTTEKMTALETILYGKDATAAGNDGVAPRLPMPDEVASILAD